MAVTRRQLLAGGAAALLASSCRVFLASPDRPARAAVGDSLLLVVFLEGGADGLDLVPPIGDRDYARVRGRLAPDALPFTPGFGLHPALAPLKPYADAGQIAVVHACGLPDTGSGRSHFEARARMELGIADGARPLDGWLTRALADESQESAFATLALAPRRPLSLAGSPALRLPDRPSLKLYGATPADLDALEAMYEAATGDDPFARAGSDALEAVRRFRRLTGGELPAPLHPATPGTFAARAQTLIALEEAGLGLRAAYLTQPGWDTHAAQEWQVAHRAADLGHGLALLLAELGSRRDLRLVVLTEFGRTAAPNGSGGTDHGLGSAVLVAGPSVRGGVYGDWPGLASSRLHDGRELAVTTDYRSVLVEVLLAHRGAPLPEDSFPGFRPTSLGVA